MLCTSCRDGAFHVENKLSLVAASLVYKQSKVSHTDATTLQYSTVPPLINSIFQNSLFHFLSESDSYVSTYRKRSNIMENVYENAVLVLQHCNS